MTPEQFDDTLRALTNRRPFEPFVVELVSGERIVVPHPEVAFGGGAAVFIGEDEGLVGFSSHKVRSIQSLVPESAR